MTPSLEGGCQPCIQDAGDLPGGEDPPAQGEHVEVVVGPRHARALDVVAGRGPYALYLVRRYGHADPRPAEKHPAVGLALRDGPGRLERDIGIVHPLLRMGPEVQQPDLRVPHKTVHLDNISCFHLVRRYIYFPAVYCKMSVSNKLSRFLSR